MYDTQLSTQFETSFYNQMFDVIPAQDETDRKTIGRLLVQGIRDEGQVMS